MRRTLGLFALGLSFWFSGCMSMDMPIEPQQEASRTPEKDPSEKKEPGTTTITVVSRCEFTIPVYRKRPETQIEEEKEKIGDIDKLCMLSRSKSFTDAEEQFEPLFDIFDKISGTGPEFDFDIIRDRGTDYPALRLYPWSGIYYAPYLLVKNSKLSISTLAHEDGHRKDRHYSKWDYAFDWSKRCRMEAVAVAHQHLVADYFCNVYDLPEIAREIWEDVRLPSGTISFLKKFETFEDFYNDKNGIIEKRRLDKKLEYIVGRVIYHVILYKNKGNPVRTFRFLSRHDDKEVFEAVYDVLEKKNYVDAIEESIRMAGARMYFGSLLDDLKLAIGGRDFMRELQLIRSKKKN